MNLRVFFQPVGSTSLLLILPAILMLGGCAETRTGEEYMPISGGGPQAAVPVGPSFKFVVIGDTRTGVAVFKRNIDEINQIDPDLVINVGDLINGYTDEAEKIEAMWNEFEQHIRGFQVPFVMVPGNHDIWSPLAEKFYQQRYGKTYFSFNYINVHFVVLNSEALDSTTGQPLGRLDDEQLQWLAKDLESHRRLPFTFVFLHHPLWVGGPEGHWMRQVHPILARYKVSAVFAGHVHEYRRCRVVDHVRYYITGGGGAELRGPPEEGGFHHYCLVTVRPRYWRLAVVKTGSVFRDTVITEKPVRTTSAPATTRPMK